MKLYRAKDYQDMSLKAANIVSAQVTLKPASVLGLATGSTPQAMYHQLGQRCQNGDLDFSQIRTINLDEYKGLAPDNTQSYRYYMQENLFSRINIQPENTHLPDGLAKDETAECTRYNAMLTDLGGIDLQVLGIGANGHIGFNEPGDAFQKETHCVALTESTIQANSRFFATVDEVPKFAYTMGIQSIMQARKILIMVSGAEKADALYEALHGPITPAVPASVLQLHSDVIVVADEGALSRF